MALKAEMNIQEKPEEEPKWEHRRDATGKGYVVNLNKKSSEKKAEPAKVNKPKVQEKEEKK